MSKVISLGQMLVDLTMRIDRVPEPGGDAFADEAVARVGSSFNILHAVRQMGVSAAHGGIIGTGPWATQIREALATDGIEHIGLTDFSRDSGICMAMTDARAERTFVTVRGAETQGDEHCFDAIAPEGSDIVHINGYTFAHPTARGLLAFLERCQSHDFTTVFDPSSVTAGAEDRLLSAIIAHHPIWSCNYEEALALARRLGIAGAMLDDTGNTCAALSTAVEAPVILRAGSSGAWLCEKPGRSAELIASHHVHAVDTNGAGDCHVGVMSAELIRGASLHDAVRMANIAAAISVTRRGPATCPSRGELAALVPEFQ
ncbi:PfkB family carbohydrate kinase [Bifidobacterium cebidarum]|uniref:Kinase, PfkB family n=1 Tax=Bifidobacterium cebidarum TaxID=2650773 RepID=A0A6I1G9U1_9BIFI|nr:PfkB family carbohydrate kinase [Bifidobacterium cebidarum]KAB7788295.1 Kinase, PfkB family [Bifidobacterium cebidarum]